MRKLPRGTVTFLFTDMEGSTRLLHTLGPEAYASALADHRQLLRDAFARHEGVEVDTQGDAFFVAFSSVEGAFAAAREATLALSGPVRVRMGLHTGTPHVTDEGYVGEDVHLGARIAAAGHGGQVLVSRAARDLMDGSADLLDLGEHRLKDFAEPVWIFQLGREPFPPLKTISNTNLPRPVSSFVGRECETAEVAALLRDGSRLVTLSGPGGSGKTRLAIEVAAELVPEFKNGVFWVGLAALRDPALVAETIGETLGSKDGLGDHVGERELLLLLDNLEQVIDAAPELAALLEICPNLRLLVTSRELLRVRGEIEYAVPPLAEREAVELFCQRSQLAADATIGELCRRMDNLPLAVELSAARTSALSPAQILERLSQRLDLLKGGRDAEARQQTLRATIKWSYDLLAPEEQTLLRCLSVFVGGCTLEAAEQVADADLDTLQSLVDKSLLRHTGERFWMLETIREYALERLARHGENLVVSQAHAEHYAAMVERLSDQIRDTAGGRDIMRNELDNVRAALAWALETNAGTLGARLMEATWPFWISSANVREGLGWSRQFLELTRALDPVERLGVLHAVSELTRFAGDLDAAERLKSEELAIARAAPDQQRRLARVLADLTWIAAERGDFPRAHALSEEALALRVAMGEERGVAQAQTTRAGVLFFEGRFEDARDLYRETARMWKQAGVEEDHAGSVLMCAECSRRLGELRAAREGLRSALELFTGLGERFSIPECLQEVAAFALACGNPETAALLLGAAERHRLELGIPLWQPQDRDQSVADARSALPAERFDECWQKGAGLTLEDAVAAALAALD